MNVCTNKKNRKLKQGRTRQQFFRERQGAKGLTTLQARITKACNYCLVTIAKDYDISTEKVLEMAIASQQGKLPDPPPAITTGDLIGTIKINKWIEPSIRDGFDAFGYKHRDIAINAIVHAYYKELGYFK